MKFKVGDKVKLNKKVKSFVFGRSGVSYDEIGEITHIWGTVLRVQFPGHCFAWHGLGIELELG